MKPMLFLFILISGGLTVVGQNTPAKFVAHRGASYLAPENTMASILLAWELGADAAECDIMLTRDNRIVLFHDQTTGRMTGTNLKIRDTDYAVLSQLTIKPGKHNTEKFDNERIPLLENILPTIPDDRLLVIEIKTGTEILPVLMPIIQQYSRLERLSFICFDLETIIETKKYFPSVPCYYLASFRQDIRRYFDVIVQSNLDGLNLRYKIISRNLTEKCRAAGLDVWCWTVNDPVTAARLIETGVTHITTDRPAWLKNQLSRD
ncbi:MAG: hypothetical protein JXR52_09480 [Bacteroidales bacterium]|nr:hypothetical protein [Bacteroidales bacterium]MBN2699047.1 hypothetical protein [Bacteroidales bacterium]